MPINHDPAAATGLPICTLDLLPFARRTDADAGSDGDEPRRPARILPFPAPPAERCAQMAGLAKVVAARLELGHVELLDAAAELLALSDFDFAAQLRGMQADEAGRALLAELIGSVQGAAIDFDRGSRVLFVLRGRITAGLGQLGENRQ